MTAILLIAAIVLFFLAAGWYHERAEHERTRRAHSRTYAALVESEEHRDAVKRSALKGAPLVKWHRDLAAGLPAGADMWYWRINISGEPHLFTEEAVDLARKRASHLLANTTVPHA